MSTEAAASCTHRVTRWDVNNRWLVCSGCGAEFKPGHCLHCGGVALHPEGFVCAAHSARGVAS